MRVRIHLFYLNADPNPDPGSQINADTVPDPDPCQTLPSKKVGSGHEKYTLPVCRQYAIKHT
jgi:hypothetical protein